MNMMLSERDLAGLAQLGQGTSLGVGLVLMPACNLLSVSAAADLLHAARRHAPVSCRILTETGQPVRSSSGPELAAQGTWADLGQADLVLVFGDEDGAQPPSPGLADRLRRAWACGATVGGIGAGLEVLAAAGLLTGRRFSLHWAEAAGFARRWPGLVPCHEAFCLDQGIATCPDGPLVGDMILCLLQERFGAEVPRRVMQGCMILERRQPRDPQRLGQPACPDTDHAELNAALRFTAKHFREPDVMQGLQRVTGLSRRHIERLFRRQVGASPAQHVAALRLGHAQRLLSRTDLSVAQIATEAGFNSTGQFSKRFRQHFGRSPYEQAPGL